MTGAAPTSAGFGDVDQLACRPRTEALGGYNADPFGGSIIGLREGFLALSAFGTAP